MSPLYGYNVHQTPAKKNEFVEVVFRDASDSENSAGIEMKESSIDNPVYESDNDFSNKKKVKFFT